VYHLHCFALRLNTVFMSSSVPTLYHTFHGFVKGLSLFHVNPVDVRKIVSISYRKRWFCIRDRNYPHQLSVKYSNPITITVPVPFVPIPKLILWFPYPIYLTTSSMTLRYMTHDEVLVEMASIEVKKQFIEKVDEKANEQLQRQFMNELHK
jgi:hypothetical protein